MISTAARTTTTNRVAALDGLRAIAIAAVFAYHLGLPFSFAGRLGVDVFFPLSGFLITGVLLREHATTDRVRLGRFYARRALRLYPALGAAVLVTFALHGRLFASVSEWATSAGHAVTYTTNIWIGFQHGPAANALSPTWSLALEEQFYLLWPLALLAMFRLAWSHRRMAQVALFLATCSWVSLFVATNAARAYFRPDARVGGLLFGCATALFLSARPVSSERATELARIGAVCIGVAVMLGAGHANELFGNMFGIPLMSLGVALALPWASGSSERGLRRVLSTSVFTWLGRRSYSLYLIHFPVVLLLRSFELEGVALTAMAVLVAGMAADVMYRFVEQPALRWHDARHLAPTH